MDQQRWRQIERIHHSALEHPHSKRAAFVAGECKNDEELRREVESLLGRDAAPGEELIDRPAWEGAGDLLKTKAETQPAAGVTSDWRQVTEPKALVVSPVEELTNGARIRSAPVLVADIGREEFNEAVLSSSAGSRDYCRQVFPAQTDQARRHDHDCFRFHQSIPISVA